LIVSLFGALKIFVRHVRIASEGEESFG
jgi:hypothetical protein